MNKKYFSITVLLILAALARLIGLSHGLPLWVVGDEPSFIFGALKMIELQTLLPVFHDAAFKGLFYYTPFLSYLYLIPFIFLMGMKWLFFSGNLAEFKNYLITDLSQFFIIARLFSVVFGVSTILLVYQISKNIFKRELTAFFSAAFLSFSLLHVIFSHWARHWAPAAFVFSLIIYVLSQPNFSVRKRYLLASLLCGIGTGITLQIGLAVLYIVLWFFFYDQLSLFKEVKKKWFWQAIIIFFSLETIEYLIWPRGFYVAAGASQALASHKTLLGLLASYAYYFLDILRREPIFLFFIIIGLIVCALKWRGFFLATIIFVLAYIAIFYGIFVNTSRFMLLLYPLFALMAGYGLNWSYELATRLGRLYGYSLVMIIFIPVIAAVIKFDYLLLKNDTRTQALDWINTNIPDHAKVAVMADLLHLPSTPEAIKEQQALDPESLRTVDQAELNLSDKFWHRLRFHTLHLNANSLKSTAIYKNLAAYLKSHSYEYVVFTPTFAEERGALTIFNAAGKELYTMAGFKNIDNTDTPTDGSGFGLAELFVAANLGPDIIIKKIDH